VVYVTKAAIESGTVLLTNISNTSNVQVSHLGFPSHGFTGRPEIGSTVRTRLSAGSLLENMKRTQTVNKQRSELKTASVGFPVG